MNITIDPREGMEIIKLGKEEQVFTLVQSNMDDALYGVFEKTVIKLDDENINDYSIVNIEHLQTEIEVIQVGDDELIKDGVNAFYYITEAIKLEEELKVITMTLEEFYKANNEYDYYFALRDSVHDFYSKSK